MRCMTGIFLGLWGGEQIFASVTCCILHLRIWDSVGRYWSARMVLAGMELCIIASVLHLIGVHNSICGVSLYWLS